MEEKSIYKKHWVAYVAACIVLLFSIGLLLFPSVIVRIFAFILLCASLMEIIQITTVSWTITNDFIIIKSGWLPWRKHEYNIPVYGVYESFSRNGFWGHVLKYGEVILRRNDGRNSIYRGRQLKGAMGLSEKINSLVHAHEKNKKGSVNNTLNYTTNTFIFNFSEEIKILDNLRREGKISPDEYETLKQRLIDQGRKDAQYLYM